MQTKQTSDEMIVLADRYRELAEIKKSLEERTKSVTAEIESTEKKLATIMVEREMPNFSRSGKLYYLENKVVGNTTSGKRDELHSAMRKHGYGDLIQEVIPQQSLSAFIKEQIEQREEEILDAGGEVESTPLPEWLKGLVSVFEQTKVRMRKSSK